VPELVNQVLANNGIGLDDLDYVIFHQANKFILEYLRKIIGIPQESSTSNARDRQHRLGHHSHRLAPEHCQWPP
jgi:3-oxoacyl-[acyl-carrier-protein] synthase III